MLVIQPVLMVAAAWGMVPLAKAIGCSRPQVGVMALAAGTSNNGFTLGAFLCYSVLDPPEAALAYATAFVTVTSFSIVVLFYPLARHYGQDPSDDGSTLKLILSTFTDLRAMPLYAGITGVILAITQTPFPDVIQQWWLLDVLFYVCSFGAYLGIGLRLRLGDSFALMKHHALLAGVKFVAIPLIAAVLLVLIGLTPWPLDRLGQQVVRIETAMPVAIMTVMLANLFHLDVRMASALWVWNTVVFIAVPLGVILWVYTNSV